MAAVLVTVTPALGACNSDAEDDAGPAATTSSTNAPATATTAAAAPAGAAGDAVAYRVDAIAYTDVTAPAGGTIDIVNSSGAAHTFTADDGGLFDVAFAANESASVAVPARPGAYPFHCDIHPGMQATLTVE